MNRFISWKMFEGTNCVFYWHGRVWYSIGAGERFPIFAGKRTPPDRRKPLHSFEAGWHRLFVGAHW